MNKRSALLIAALTLAFVGGLFHLARSTERAIITLQKRGVPYHVDSVTQSALEGDLRTLELLRRAKAPLERRDSTGTTPLIAALQAGKEEPARFLARHVDDLEVTDAAGMTALSHTVLLEQWEFAEALIGRGALIEFSFGEGRPALVEAAGTGHQELLQFLLRHGANGDVRDHRGWTALLNAVALGDSEAARSLLQAGANPDAHDRRGNSPVLLATRREDLAMLRALSEAGADLQPDHPDGVTPLEVAVARNDTEIALFLLENGALPQADPGDLRFPLLLTAVLNANDPLTRALVKAEAPLDAADPSGRTPLLAAVEARNESLFHFLADLGADCAGCLRPVLESENDSMIDVVLDAGVDLEEVDGHGETALAAMVRQGRSGLARKLLVHGARADVRCAEGQPALAWAIARQDSELMGALLGNEADVNAILRSPVSSQLQNLFGESHVAYYLKRDSGITPLMLAAGTNQKRVVQALMGRGARTSVFTRRHKTYPIHFATQLGDTGMIQMLLGRNPDPANQDRWITIDLSQQRAWLFRSGKVYSSTSISTGKSGYETPTGEYVITNKYRDWTSTLYDSKMPYFMRLNCGDFGLHEGHVPSYPASHGCVRLPAGKARKFYELAKVGDRVTIKR